MDYIIFIIKLFTFSVALLFLLIVVLRKMKKNMDKLSQGKYIKIIEKQHLSKTESVYVLKLGEEGSVILSSGNSIKKIKDLTKEDMENIEKQKEEVNSNMVLIYNENICNIKNKTDKFLLKFKR